MVAYLECLWQLVWGGLRLDAHAVRILAAAPGARLLGATVLLLAGLSFLLTSSVVLLINRVPRARLVGTSVLLAGLSSASALVWIGAIWVLGMILFGRSTSADLVLLAGFAYAPLTLSVLTVLPYVGLAVATLLNTWAVFAMVTAVHVGFDLEFFPALGCTVLAWVVVRKGPYVAGPPLARHLELLRQLGRGRQSCALVDTVLEAAAPEVA